MDASNVNGDIILPKDNTPRSGGSNISGKTIGIIAGVVFAVIAAILVMTLPFSSGNQSAIDDTTEAEQATSEIQPLFNSFLSYLANGQEPTGTENIIDLIDYIGMDYTYPEKTALNLEKNLKVPDEYEQVLADKFKNLSQEYEDLTDDTDSLQAIDEYYKQYLDIVAGENMILQNFFDYGIDSTISLIDDTYSYDENTASSEFKNAILDRKQRISQEIDLLNMAQNLGCVQSNKIIQNCSALNSATYVALLDKYTQARYASEFSMGDLKISAFYSIVAMYEQIYQTDFKTNNATEVSV